MFCTFSQKYGFLVDSEAIIRSEVWIKKEKQKAFGIIKLCLKQIMGFFNCNLKT